MWHLTRVGLCRVGAPLHEHVQDIMAEIEIPFIHPFDTAHVTQCLSLQARSFRPQSRYFSTCDTIRDRRQLGRGERLVA